MNYNYVLFHGKLFFIYNKRKGLSKNYQRLLVFGPLGSEQMAKKRKLSSVSGGKLGYGTVTGSCYCLRGLVVLGFRQRRGRRTQGEEECIEHPDDLTKARSQVRIFNPAWLYDEGKIRGHVFRKPRPLMLQSQMQIISSLSRRSLRILKWNKENFGNFEDIIQDLRSYMRFNRIKTEC